MRQQIVYDFELAEHGSIHVLTPLTEDAADWAERRLPLDCPRWAGGYAIEARFVGDIVEGVNDEGMLVRRECE